MFPNKKKAVFCHLSQTYLYQELVSRIFCSSNIFHQNLSRVTNKQIYGCKMSTLFDEVALHSKQGSLYKAFILGWYCYNHNFYRLVQHSMIHRYTRTYCTYTSHVVFLWHHTQFLLRDRRQLGSELVRVLHMDVPFVAEKRPRRHLQAISPSLQDLNDLAHRRPITRSHLNKPQSDNA